VLRSSATGDAGTWQPISLGALSSTLGVVGRAYSGTITLSGGIPAYDNLTVTGQLPQGVTAMPSGDTLILSGTPTQSGTFSFTVTLNLWGTMISQTYSLTINPALSLGSLSAGPWIANHTGSGSIPIIGGLPGYSNLVVTNKPSWLNASLSGSSIALGGVPAQAGTYSFTVSLQDSTGATVSGSYSLTVAPQVLTSFRVTTSTATVSVGGTFTVTVQALDQAGAVMSYSGNVTVASSNTTDASSAVVSLSNGSGTSLPLTAAHSGTVTYTASAGSAQGTSAALTVNPTLFTYTWKFIATDVNGTVLATDDYTNVASNYAAAYSDAAGVFQAWAQALSHTVNYYHAEPDLTNTTAAN
jgi:hypothetical protein